MPASVSVRYTNPFCLVEKKIQRKKNWYFEVLFVNFRHLLGFHFIYDLIHAYAQKLLEQNVILIRQQTKQKWCVQVSLFSNIFECLFSIFFFNITLTSCKRNSKASGQVDEFDSQYASHAMDKMCIVYSMQMLSLCLILCMNCTMCSESFEQFRRLTTIDA